MGYQLSKSWTRHLRRATALITIRPILQIFRGHQAKFTLQMIAISLGQKCIGLWRAPGPEFFVYEEHKDLCLATAYFLPKSFIVTTA